MHLLGEAGCFFLNSSASQTGEVENWQTITLPVGILVGKTDSRYILEFQKSQKLCLHGMT